MPVSDEAFKAFLKGGPSPASVTDVPSPAPDDAFSKFLSGGTSSPQPTTPIAVPKSSGFLGLPVDVPTPGAVQMEPLSVEAMPSGAIDPKQRKKFVQDQINSIKNIAKLRNMGVSEDRLAPYIENAFGKAVQSGAFQSTMKILDHLQIPQRVLFNTLARVQDGSLTPESFVKGFEGAITGKERKNTKDLMDKALSELEDAGFISPLVAGAIKDNPSYKALTFASDVLVDPLNGVSTFTRVPTAFSKAYRAGKVAEELGLPTVKLADGAEKVIREFYHAAGPVSDATAGRKALVSFMSRPVIYGDQIERATAPLRTAVGQQKTVKMLRDLAAEKLAQSATAAKVTNVLDKVKGAFSNSTGIPGLDEIMDNVRRVDEVGKRDALETGIEIGKRLKGQDIEQVNLISKVLDEGLKYEVIHDVTKLGKGAKPGVVQLTPETAAVTEHVRDLLSQIKDAELQKGILRTQIENYFPRVSSKELRQSLDDSAGSFSILKRPSRVDKTPFDRERLTKDFTLDQFNQYQRDGKDIAEAFIKDPGVALAVRKASSTRALAAADMLDQISERFALQGEKAVKGVDLGDLIPRLKGQKFDPEVAKQIKRQYEIFVNPQKQGEFLKIYNAVQNWWKGWTLGVYPSYHVRNAVGNVWNNFISGVEDPRRYYDAFRIQKGLDGHLITSTGQKITYEQLRKGIRKYGVEGTGMFGADIPEQIGTALGKDTSTLASKIGGRANPAQRAGFVVGKNIENNARVAHFIDKVAKGATFEEAAKSVGKALFDYGDITKFEKDYMRTVMPFYTWTRKNIPLQLESLVKRPRDFSTISKLRTAIQGNADDPYPESPDFIRENVPWKIRTLENGNHEYWLMGGWLPASDIEKVLHPIDTVTDMLGPIPTEAVRRLAPQVLRMVAPKASESIKNELNQPAKFLGMDMTKGTRATLKQFRPAAEIDKLMTSKTPFGEDIPLKSRILNFMTGIKTYQTSPARDVARDRSNRAELLKELLNQERYRKKG